jgi:16S rRNA processing protein RimM
MAIRDREAPPFAERVCLGEISGAHGIKGQVKLVSFTAEPAAIVAYGPLTDVSGEKEYALKVTGKTKSHLLAEIAGINDRDAAAALRGVQLYVTRDRLPAPEADEFYHGDLIGLTAELASGGTLGTVRAVADYGAGVMIEIARDSGPSVMVPFTRAAVPEIALDEGRIVVDPSPELLGLSAVDDRDDEPNKEGGE